jgi:GTP cyclohydrolase I
MRGVRDVESVTHTTFWRGAYDADSQLRAEFLNIVQACQARHRA